MRIEVDQERCEGHGLCEERAPQVFTLDDEGNLSYAFDGQDVPADRVDEAESGAVVCPVAALKIVR
ncbi:ferredoxin [Rhodococcoides corynebacterioides]|uniref:ferredoxin n=1 Tax=Rhodococcoides corynebacterioides TaxID=53972 RepID=UPI001C9B9774|nr:ferredoxin [Rhodococcus corynebacterioides]MBY6364619.1 ferredoxin [Rhodococcus corynebacterioides]